MPRLGNLILAACLATTPIAIAQEVFPPVQVGGGGSSTRQVNGQTVEVSVTGPITVLVNYSEISASRVTGNAALVQSGQGTVRVRWVNRGREVLLHLGPSNPDQLFGMEGGDVDKRSGEIAPD